MGTVDSNQIIHGDFRDVLVDLDANSVSAVITDPPYGRRTLPLYQDTLTLASRVLEPGGVLLMILPHYAMPEIMHMNFGTLQWRWLLNMDQRSGSYARLVNSRKSIKVSWKPIGWWYQPGGPKDFAWMTDSFENPPPDKSQHKWAQSPEWAEYCLEFVREGGLVVDPMCGTGTVPVACVRSGRPFIGVDIDEEQVARSLTGIGKEQKDACW